MIFSRLLPLDFEAAGEIPRNRSPLLFTFFLCAVVAGWANAETEVHPYVGASFTLTPSASATSGASDYYTVVSAGLSWNPSALWSHQAGYDLGIDTLEGTVTTFSTLSFGTLYRLSDFLRPKLSFQNTFSNGFDFYGAKLKAALRLIPSASVRLDPGLLLYVDTGGSRAVGGFLDLNLDCTDTWSVQLTAQLLGNLDQLSAQSTQSAIGAGVTHELSNDLSLYASLNYSTGISTSPVLAASGGGGKKIVSAYGAKAGKVPLADFSGTSKQKTSMTVGMLFNF